MEEKSFEPTGTRAEVLNRIVRPIPSMRRLGQGDQIDRMMVRRIVQNFANRKGINYEAAHMALTARAVTRWGYDAPDVTPDNMLTPRQVERRRELRAKINRVRELKAKAAPWTDDGDGHRGDA